MLPHFYGETDQQSITSEGILLHLTGGYGHPLQVTSR